MEEITVIVEGGLVQEVIFPPALKGKVKIIVKDMDQEAEEECWENEFE